MISLPLIVNLSGDIPVAKRVEQLSPFFKPVPGQVLKVDETDFQNLDEKGSPFLHRGFLEVKAPQKSCFTIRKDANTRDIRICNGKQARIAYSLEEIDDFDFNWRCRYLNALIKAMIDAEKKPEALKILDKLIDLTKKKGNCNF